MTLINHKYINCIIYSSILCSKIRYYQYDRGGGDGDEFCGDSRFFDFLGSKSKFLLS